MMNTDPVSHLAHARGQKNLEGDAEIAICIGEAHCLDKTEVLLDGQFKSFGYAAMPIRVEFIVYSGDV